VAINRIQTKQKTNTQKNTVKEQNKNNMKGKSIQNNKKKALNPEEEKNVDNLIHIENPTRCNSVSKFYFIFI
jgi:hypothetical protein